MSFFSGWRQSKIAKVESGQAKRLSLDDVFALAAALGVAPVYLFTPSDSNVDVQLGAKITRPAHYIREWIRGDLPLFDPEEDPAGARFYLVESVPIEQWDSVEWLRYHRSAVMERNRVAREASLPLGEWDARKEDYFKPEVDDAE